MPTLMSNGFPCFRDDEKELETEHVAIYDTII